MSVPQSLDGRASAHPHAGAPPTRPRLAAAVLVALTCTSIFLGRAHLQDVPAREVGGDVRVTMVGAQRLLAGENIYATHPSVYDAITGAFAAGAYPLPAYAVVLPFSFVAPPLFASALWVFATSLLGAWLLSARGLSRLLVFASYPVVKLVSCAQWEVLILCGAASPWAAAFVACKPQVGLPLLVAFPDRRRLLAVAGAVLLSLLWMPSWPLDWLGGLPPVPGVVETRVEAFRGADFEVLLLRPGGFLVLLALWRWRDWRARMLLATALMPQALNFHHQLPLAVVPQTPARQRAWVALTWVGAAIWGLGRWRAGGAFAWDVGAAACVLTLWLPTLLFVLFPPRGDETGRD
ncbi:MAG: hypothetical protein NDJ94_11555 [Vicinamibacteria bacterium]|nr:hypothetical protein [Vicinamibacteria bacterium]